MPHIKSLKWEKEDGTQSQAVGHQHTYLVYEYKIGLRKTWCVSYGLSTIGWRLKTHA